ncbi:MAG: hypothetical protein A2Z86_07640 [Candidatus Glassbacteria bacterium GWA2_58_10]|uniref:PilZ domain-containing protein n=1 Tax=Candidatus Glassbacteria bacterium GWA2_58_10 TaxID=1817865 RepID=A0A1F5YDA8_9BACT|nr:MAG: hypothetical protein A2Z86_07640 [Candidatus Glassbacteria bacterium GWA2_58_10]HAZ13937.1 hypothetical protein [Bdellovibrionales bacterium]
MVISGKEPSGRRSSRIPLIADVDLIVDSKVLRAMTVDISDTGVRIDMRHPFEVSIRFVVDGELQDRRAQLVRATKTPDDCMSYGFEYVPEEKPDK